MLSIESKKEVMKMANEKKNLNGLAEENKESVAGGDIYYSCEGRRGRYYIPDPSAKGGTYWKIVSLDYVEKCGTSKIHRYSTHQEAQNAAASEGYIIASGTDVPSDFTEDYIMCPTLKEWKYYTEK